MSKTTKTPAEYLTQAILWLQTKEKGNALISVLICWLMQTRCRGGSKTAHTDGANVWINEAWFAGMPVQERAFIFAHEAMHGVLRHVAQMKVLFGKPDGKSSGLWRRSNIANDAWINTVLEQALGFRLSDGVYPDTKLPDGKPLFNDVGGFNPDEHDWLWLFQRINKDASGEGAGSGDDLIEGDEADDIEADLRAGRAIAQGAARSSQQRGTGGGWLDRLLGSVSQPVQDWKSQLWDIVTSSIPADWSMRRVNKTYACAGGLVGTVSHPGMGVLVVATDTSGSMTDEILAQPVAEVNAMLPQLNPEKLYQLWVDADVANVQEIEQHGAFTPEPRGGGGTSFIPAFDWVRDNVAEGVGCMIYFTDGYGDWDNVEPPSYPVVWFIVAGGTDEDPPFGRVIRMMPKKR